MYRPLYPPFSTLLHKWTYESCAHQFVQVSQCILVCVGKVERHLAGVAAQGL